MKLIIAKQSGSERIAYINADRINSFHTDVNPYDNRKETKIYFTEGKCVIDGDRAEEMAVFMSGESDCGLLDLVNEHRKSFWEKRGEDDAE